MQKLVEESRLIVISSSLSNVVGKNKKIKKEGGDDAQAVDPPSRQQGAGRSWYFGKGGTEGLQR